jgi:hypothetical protein
MDFSFDLKWQSKNGDKISASDIAATLVSDPVLFLNPGGPIDPNSKTIYSNLEWFHKKGPSRDHANLHEGSLMECAFF